MYSNIKKILFISVVILAFKAFPAQAAVEWTVFTNATITVNEAEDFQNCTFYNSTIRFSADATLKNSIIWNESGTDITIDDGVTVTGAYNWFQDSASSGSGTYSDGGGTVWSGGDPHFSSVETGDFTPGRIMPGDDSLLDNGDTDLGGTLLKTGGVVVAENGVEIGAYESENDYPEITVTSGTDVGPTNSDSITLTASGDSVLATADYGFSDDDTCDSSDTYGNNFSSGSAFNITSDHTDYLCSRAIDSYGNIVYQLVGLLNVDGSGSTLSFSDDVEAGPVVSDTISVSWGDATLKKWDYSLGTTCSEISGDYSKTDSDSMDQTDSTNNNNYICLYAEDSVGNISTLISTNDININQEANQEATINNSSQKKQLSSSKIYLKDKTNKLKGQTSLTSGTVKIYANGKKLGETSIDSDGSWQEEIKFNSNKSYELKIKTYNDQDTEIDSQSYKVKIDNEDPELRMVTVSEGRAYFSALDEETKVDYYKVKLLDVQGHIVRKWRKQKEQYYYIPESVLPGRYTLIVRSYDKAGNYSEEQTALNVGEQGGVSQHSSLSDGSGPETLGVQSNNNFQSADCTYIIQKGDTLYSIASQVYGSATQYQRIVDLNPGLKANVLEIGQELKLCNDDQSQENSQSSAASENSNQQTQPQTQPQPQPQTQTQTQTQTQDFRWWNPSTWF